MVVMTVVNDDSSIAISTNPLSDSTRMLVNSVAFNYYYRMTIVIATIIIDNLPRRPDRRDNREGILSLAELKHQQ